MNFFTKKRSSYLSIAVLLLVIVFFLVSKATHTFAYAMPTTDPLPNLANVDDPSYDKQNNQVLRRSTSNENNTTLQGDNQGNSGNQGTNQGNNQDNNTNGGNQVSGLLRGLLYQENKQSLARTTNDQNNITYQGTNQGNSGNQGTNQGNNQDNAGNSGNQVNNQANTIGTQINEQGSEVNNDGSTIHKQVNYVNLVPSTQVNSLPGEPLSLGVEKGWYLLVPLRMR